MSDLKLNSLSDVSEKQAIKAMCDHIIVIFNTGSHSPIDQHPEEFEGRMLEFGKCS